MRKVGLAVSPPPPGVVCRPRAGEEPMARRPKGAREEQMRWQTLVRFTFFLLVFSLPLAAQTNNSSITGTVLDSTGAAVPDATVTARNQEQNTVVTTVTNADGIFVFPQLLPATYTLTVEKAGFKKFEKRDLMLNNNSTLSAGIISLEVGTVQQTVEVVAQGAQLQTDTSEQATSIVGTQIENVNVAGRSFLTLLTVVPGIYTEGEDFSRATNQTGSIYSNGTRGGTFNLTLNGASNLDTGSNSKMMATVSLDSVQEFRVLTANFDAQYGKNSGAQIQVITKSGTRDFHGGGYWFFRDKGLNANSWTNNRDGSVGADGQYHAIPRPGYHFNYFGYRLGGPAYIPGKFNTSKNKLFFFWSEEYQRQLMPEGVRNVTVPTAIERQGDFSQSVDQNGNKVYIRDSLTSLTCSSSNTAGCFQDQGIIGKIPAARLYAPGLAVLKLFPLPNVTGQRTYNYRSQLSSANPRHEQLLKMDYYATSKWRFSGSLTRLAQDVVTSWYCPSGYSLCPNFPLTPIQYDHPGYVLVLNATTTLSATAVNEFMFDIAHHPVSVLPKDMSALTRATTGINLPTLFPPYADWIPRMAFGGSRIANSPSLDTGGGEWTPFNTYNSTIEWIDNFSKIRGTHLIKAGAFIHRNRKNQSAYAKTGGHYDFGDNSANPYDTGFGFSNAAIGTFYTFQQANRYLMGQYRYSNAEFYVQDSWKVNRRLTLNYGVRANYVQPYYDAGGNGSNFLPDLWDSSKAPRLYWPTYDANRTRVGIDNATGQTVSSQWIGYLVPNTGALTNGLRQSGQGISKYLMKSPGILWGPRVGIAWDVTGKQKTVFRTGAGVYYDRYQGNNVFNTVMNPPVMMNTTVYNGLAAQMATPTTNWVTPSAIQTPIDYNGRVPTVLNYSAGIQTRLPWKVKLDMAYVGSTSRHLIQTTNLNAVPYGADWLPQNQDPTKSGSNALCSPRQQYCGNNAYDTNYLRPYRGFGDINMQQFGATANYNSLQVKADRTIHGIFFNTAFTWARCLATASGDGDGFRIDGLSRFSLYGPCSYNIPLNLTFNYVYSLPRVKNWGAFNNVATRALFDGWQVSGLTQFRNGTATDVGYSLPNYNNQTLTGSNTQSARVWLVGDPKKGTTDSPYNRLSPDAFLPPQVGSIGIESPRRYLVGPGRNNWDVALQRDVRITEKTKLQLRCDAFNVFNHTQFSGLNTTINFTSITNPTPTNMPFNSAGVLVNKNGFGTISGVRSPRVMQVVARFVF